MKISEKRTYTTERNIFKHAHIVTDTNTAEGTWTDGIVPHGAIYPANDATAKGVVYHDTEVGQPMTLILEGHLYADRLPEAPTLEAVEALRQINFYTSDSSVFEAESGL